MIAGFVDVWRELAGAGAAAGSGAESGLNNRDAGMCVSGVRHCLSVLVVTQFVSC